MSSGFVTLSPLEQGPQQLRGAQPRPVPILNPTLSESIVGRTAEAPSGTQIPTRFSLAAQRYVTSHRLKSTLYVAQKLLSKLHARAQSVRIDLVHDPEIADYSRLLVTVGINEDRDISFAYEQLLDFVAEEIPLQDGLHFIFTVEAEP